MLAMDRNFLTGKAPSSFVTVEAGETAALPLGSPLRASLKAAPKGGVVSFSLEAPKIEPGLSVAVVTSRGGDMYSQAEEPKVTVSEADDKVVGEFSMEYG